jgi:hypothetical protein
MARVGGYLGCHWEDLALPLWRSVAHPEAAYGHAPLFRVEKRMP